MNWKVRAKRAIPTRCLNELLLRWPALYRTRLVNYETTLTDHHGIEELLAQLGLTLDLQGDIVECGSSRGGASVIMAQFARTQRVSKTIYAYDSFEGFDRTELERERAAGLTHIAATAFTSTSYQYVQRKLSALGVDDTVIPVPGYFQATLPQLPHAICFALIDCDLRDSLVFCAQMIWPRLVSQGRIVFDDYRDGDFKGARLGVNDFVMQYQSEILEHGLLNRLYYVCKR